MTFRRTLDMSIGREEFLRLLAAVGPFETLGDTLRSSDDGDAWAVRLVPLAPGRLGALSIPRHRVEIVLEGRSPVEGAVFMGRFNRAFTKGGG